MALPKLAACRNHWTNSIFGNSGAAQFLAGAASVNSIPKLHSLPEVIVTGRANCGKSSLFNAVLGRKDLLHTSKKAGRTRELNFYRVGPEPGKLVLVDAPGYGARGRPEWGSLFDHYLDAKKELRRIYILFNAKHTLTPADTQMLAHLSLKLPVSPHFTLQAVITKVDCVPPDKVAEAIERIRKQVSDAAPLCLPPIVTSVGMSPPFGIERMRESIAEVCGLGARVKAKAKAKAGALK